MLTYYSFWTFQALRADSVLTSYNLGYANRTFRIAGRILSAYYFKPTRAEEPLNFPISVFK